MEKSGHLCGNSLAGWLACCSGDSHILHERCLFTLACCTSVPLLARAFLLPRTEQVPIQGKWVVRFCARSQHSRLSTGVTKFLLPFCLCLQSMIVLVANHFETACIDFCSSFHLCKLPVCVYRSLITPTGKVSGIQWKPVCLEATMALSFASAERSVSTQYLSAPD